MRLQVLHVPDCPSVAVLLARLGQCVDDAAAAGVELVLVRDQAEAATVGMTGSPTLLVDGVDPFAVPSEEPSVSCRLYVDEEGARSGSPSVAQLRAVLAASPGGAQ